MSSYVRLYDISYENGFSQFSFLSACALGSLGFLQEFYPKTTTEDDIMYPCIESFMHDDKEFVLRI